MSPKRASLALCLTLLAAGCGGKSDEEKKVERSGPTGIRIHLVAGSVATGTVYGGPIPTSSSAVITAPTSNGYTLLATIGAGGATVVDLPTPYPYFLILVTAGAVSTGSIQSVRIDAIQRIPDGMFMTGRTYTGHMFYGSNVYDQDKLFAAQSGEGYAVGAPDGKYVAVYGFTLFPTLDWAP